jgi:WD40 repeat protein
VRRLAERLRDAGLRIWLDEWVIRPGDDIYLAVERGLEESRVQVLCLSPAALSSDWVALERGTVLFRDPTNAGRRFVPLLLADCELPDALRRYARVDYREETAEAFGALLGACRGEAISLKSQTTAKPKGSRPSAKHESADVKISAKPVAVLERVFTGHEDAVWSLAVSADGCWVASGSMDKTVKVWYLVRGTCRRTLFGANDYVRCPWSRS